MQGEGAGRLDEGEERPRGTKEIAFDFRFRPEVFNLTRERGLASVAGATNRIQPRLNCSVNPLERLIYTASER